MAGLAKSYRRIEDGQWEPTTRPEEDVFLDCVNAPRSAKSLSNQVLDEICSRWQKTRFFRNFQLDSQHLHYEYELLRSVSGLHVYDDDNSHRAANINSPISASNLERSRVPDSFGESFIERFHKALCLQSIANVSRRLAMATKTTDGDIPRIGMMFFEFWSWEGYFTISGHQIYPTVQDKVEQLEMMDLVYYFMLDKVLPARTLDSWILQCRETWLIDGTNALDYETSEYDRSVFLEYLRLHLSPEDIVDMVVHRSWDADSDFPHDK